MSTPAPVDPPALDLDDIHALIRDESAGIDREIAKRLDSPIVLINQLGRYIIQSGGKRLRPAVLLLAAKAFRYEGTGHIVLATVIEFIHTATLLHDDVVDGSAMRRGQASANAVFGNEASVLVGDFLYSRAFEMMVEVQNLRVMEILAHATNTIAEGEVMQLIHCNDPDIEEDRYLAVIRSKTAKLFEAAAQLGAVLGGAPAMEPVLATYGRHLGTAFQLIDDALDYGRHNARLGKNIGDDLAEGKPTLPLIHVLRTGTPAERALVRDAIEQGGLEHIDGVVAAIESTQAIAYTCARAEGEANLARAALSPLPDSPYKQALLDLAHFSVHRDH
ncbi:octaprenyl diphosphate synthase [Acidiferrobacter sp.]|uniref:octaprenyl diphosphate synthase n=1 Tax=Acidiferrobacter sp. TaxID=1872107 RepID=UPI002631BDBF|nr:octaprenyl diphosphate synthase [Acidiferrobacter sp.]